MRLAALGLACLALLALAGPAAAAQSAVSVEDNVFNPATVKIDPGDSVNWTWEGAAEHTVTATASQTERFGSRVQTAGTFNRTFAKAGRFSYFCEIHPDEMRGTVEVGSAPFPDTALPRLARPKATVRGSAARVRFRLSEAAKVTLKVRGPSRKSATRQLGKGARSLRVRGLKPGRYRATLTASDGAGNKTAKAATTRFRVSR